MISSMSLNSPVMSGVYDHYKESLNYFNENNIVGIFLQGSQNYQLSTEYSDIDTKLVVTPSLQDIILNEKLVSTTHVRENDEHIDFKDIRLYMQTFRKQNINFVEILFTDYFIVNELYADEWQRLIKVREAIAHYNMYASIKAMKGMALEKYHAMEHRYPSKEAVINQFGYDPKQLHHLLRIEEFLNNYIAGHPYEECLVSKNKEFLIKVKLGLFDLKTARKEADEALDNIINTVDKYTDIYTNECNENTEQLLLDVQKNIMTKSIVKEIEDNEH